MKRHMIYSALLLMFILFAGNGVTLGASQDLIGTWSVASQIVTICSTDPNAPKPGSFMPTQTWAITDSANGPILSSDQGSVTGQYTANGAMFEFTTTLGSDPNYGAMYRVTDIECYSDGPASMYGTFVNHFISTIYITGATFERCQESFQFKATKLAA